MAQWVPPTPPIDEGADTGKWTPPTPPIEPQRAIVPLPSHDTSVSEPQFKGSYGLIADAAGVKDVEVPKKPSFWDDTKSKLKDQLESAAHPKTAGDILGLVLPSELPKFAKGNRFAQAEKALPAVSETPPVVNAPWRTTPDEVLANAANKPTKPHITAQEFIAARDARANKALEPVAEMHDVPDDVLSNVNNPPNPNARNFEPSYDPKKLFGQVADKPSKFSLHMNLEKPSIPAPPNVSMPVRKAFNPSTAIQDVSDRRFQELLQKFHGKEQSISEPLPKANTLPAVGEVPSSTTLPAEPMGSTTSNIDRRISSLDYSGPERRGIGGSQPKSSIMNESGSTTLPSQIAEGITNYGSQELQKVKDFPSAAKEAMSKDGVLTTIGNTMRGSMSSVDLSGAFRQAAPLANRKEFWKSLVPMVKSYVSEDSFNALQAELRNHPAYDLAKKAGLALTDLGTNKEEKFMSNLAEELPILGRGVRASNRAYVGFLNKVRLDTFNSLAKDMHSLGMLDGESTQVLGKAGELADFINAATGRGKLPGNLERSAKALNAAFFSPRLMSSRLTLLNPAYYVKADPFVRKAALKSMLSLGTAVTTIAGLAKGAGAEVSFDPTNSDFMKLKFGNTRVDLGAGFQQYIVLASRLATGEYTSSTTGKTSKLGAGYKPKTSQELLGNFLQSKEAPLLSFGMDLLKMHEGGKDLGGKPLSMTANPLTSNNVLADRFLPMIVQDMRDIIKDDPSHLGAIIPGIMGAGVQTYAPTSKVRPPSLR